MSFQCKQCGAEIRLPDQECPRCGYHTRHRGFQGAWRRGFNAPPNAQCPYPDYRTNYHAGPTWSAAFRRHWLAGHDWAARNM